MTDDLQPLDPWEGIDLYLEHRQDELSARTSSSHYYRLKQFALWLDEQGIDNLNDVDGRLLHRYKVHRRDERDLAATTVKGDFDTLAMFVGVMQAFEAIRPGLKAKELIPSLRKGDSISEDELETDRAEAILNYLDRFEYASRRHASLLLIWHVGMRAGGARGIDLDDCELDSDEPGIALRHRPDEDTPLKNGEAGERDVNLSTSVAQVLRDYVDYQRIDVTDEYGREPLFTSHYGRVSRSCLQDTIYRVTRPCRIGNGECPHDRDTDDCEALEQNLACLCPSSKAPHAVRTGSVTHQRNQGIPPEIVSERVNATEETIEKHYDMRTHRDRRLGRREHLEGL